MSRSSIRKAAYLSGPMTGHDDFNYPRFHEVARKMRSLGYAVVNPAESYNGDQTLAFSTYMRWDIKQLLDGCDAVVLLEGWQKAAGAVFEVAIAAALGYSILEYRDEVGGFSLKSALPIFETDRDRLAFILGVGNGRSPFPAYTKGFEDGHAEGFECAQMLAPEPGPIQAGDTVRVLRPNVFGDLAKGALHKVTRVTDQFVYLEGWPSENSGWLHDRFEVVSRAEGQAELKARMLEVAAKPATIVASAGPEPMSTWEEADDGLLKAADHIVNGDRQRTYGHPITHHTATAAMWSAYLTRVNDEHEVIVRPQDVSILMVLDKASRIGGGDKVDNALDIAGYAQVHAKVRARQETSNGGVFE